MPSAAPRNVTFSKGSRWIKIFWQTPNRFGWNAETLTGYLIRYCWTGSQPTEQQTVQVTSPIAISYNLTGLHPYYEYAIQITAANSEGPGVPSSEQHEKTAEAGE